MAKDNEDMNTADLFGEAPRLPTQVPHQSKSPTSRAAAEKLQADPVKVTRQRRKILVTLARKRGGLIREQICNLADIKESSACAALNVLEGANFLRTDGVRKSSSNVDCQIYHLTDKGRTYLRTVGEL